MAREQDQKANNPMQSYRPDSFQQRVNYAAQCILDQDTRSREFDSCFEMHDGDVVAAALVRRAQQNAELYAAMVLWQTKGRSSDLPAEWLQAATQYQTLCSLPPKAPTIRNNREQKNDRLIKTTHRDKQ